MIPTTSSLPSPLVAIIPELWRIILKKLRQKDVLNLRMVNQDFKTKADNLYEDWIIRLDDKCPYLDMILDLRIKEVKMKKDIRLKLNPSLNSVPNRPPGILLKYLDLLTNLTIWDCEISAHNLHVLLQSKNLKSIKTGLRSSALNDVFWQTHNVYNFTKLHTLHISLFYFSTSEALVELNDGNFCEMILTRCIMPSLKSFELSFGAKLDEVSRLSLTSPLILFLGRQGQNLRHFAYQSYCGPANIFESRQINPVDDLAVLQNCAILETMKNLETFCIVSMQSFNVLMDTWRCLIQSQSKLVTFNLYSTISVSISDTICAKICAKNFETLTKVAINNLTMDERRVAGQTRRFDLSMFRRCVNLTYLELSFLPRYEDERDVELYNLLALPEKLKTLATQEFLICSDSISNYLKKLNCLLRLEIANVGKSGPYGVNLAVFKDIMTHRSLKSVEIGVDSINVPSNVTELEELNQIFSATGLDTAKFNPDRGFRYETRDLIVSKKWEVASWSLHYLKNAY